MLERLNRKVSLAYAIPVAMLLSLVNVTAADARVEFRGGGNVCDFNGCEEFDWNAASETVIARFRPAGLPGNDDSSFLTLFWGGYPYAMGLATRGTPFTRSFQEVDGAAVGVQPRLLDDNGARRQFSQVRVTRQQPRTIAADTDTVRLEGIIRHFDGLRGCTARFEFLMRQR